MGGGISKCFAMYINDKLVGGSVLGKPRHEKKYFPVFAKDICDGSAIKKYGLGEGEFPIQANWQERGKSTCLGTTLTLIVNEKDFGVRID